ncbi:type II toxin-antitoxin system RelE/ParE family toxin [Dongia sedimenti]|uniref:Type II toxin-antitoxin system RelE/ParE family toxin n=1 Tax=Dongia sedimenti TaxID=3064282 RepID=A0ABU0YR38_9PROT|nr:type II toxin-antitoxin system RelE/ParE family toxin [Rhodospirillaceae bacterium R-7]
MSAAKLTARAKVIQAKFWKHANRQAEPVRDWLLALPAEDRKNIGGDIQRVECEWPVGMPLVRSLSGGLFEVRSSLPSNKIARTLFGIDDGKMVLLHGFTKTTQKTPKADLDLARDRWREWKKHAKK